MTHLDLVKFNQIKDLLNFENHQFFMSETPPSPLRIQIVKKVGNVKFPPALLHRFKASTVPLNTESDRE